MSITQFCIDNNISISKYLVLTALLLPKPDTRMALAVAPLVTNANPMDIPSYYFDVWEKLHEKTYDATTRNAARMLLAGDSVPAVELIKQ
jgi:hypothetical protein